MDIQETSPAPTETQGFFVFFRALTISAANSSSKALLAVSACSIMGVGGSEGNYNTSVRKKKQRQI